MQRASIPSHLIKVFVDGVRTFSAQGSFRFQTPPAQEGTQGNKRKSAFSSGLKQNWRALLREAQERIREVEAEGRLVVFTDGSSVIHDDIGPVAGFGAYFGSSLDFSEFVPIKEQQSNNRAELRGLLKCLRVVLSQDEHLCWAFAIDSKYVVDGATGGAARWRESNWTTRAGKLASRVDLWLEILPLLDTLGHRVSGFHVFSHINLHGNDCADTLANQGKASSPLYTYFLPGSSPTKSRHIDVQEVAEVQVVMSSDEELDSLDQAAKRDYLLSGASMI